MHSTLTSESVRDKPCCSNFKGLVSIASGTSPVSPHGSVRPDARSFPPPRSFYLLPALSASHSQVLLSPLLVDEVVAF